MTGKRFKPGKADKLLDPKRNEILSPEQVISLLKVKETDHVADLGAGNGYFTLPLAQVAETVYAVDIEKQMLELLKERGSHMSNIQYIVSDLEEIKLPDRVADHALVAFVLHEVPNLTKAFTELKRILKPGQRLLVLEWEKIEMEMGPPIHERMSSEQMKEVFIDNGLEPEVHYFHEAVYGISAVV
ncbi:class I SAM-dependent methyltransferase [Alkalihalobacillus sp. CinArs1]|uniref:class I SAM-dependent methyltransferase n=1 Tax=Alkalihalobacillus sp. CinArs1 TaxID=2995314 RepID=UPI0022DDFEA8|nr:methyltransferase domain-containing protein [Alkalihalobacillus sp. CinArs1]